MNNPEFWKAADELLLSICTDQKLAYYEWLKLTRDYDERGYPVYHARFMVGRSMIGWVLYDTSPGSVNVPGRWKLMGPLFDYGTGHEKALTTYVKTDRPSI